MALQEQQEENRSQPLPQEAAVVAEGELDPTVARVEVDVEDVEGTVAGVMLMRKKKTVNQARMVKTVRVFLVDPGTGTFFRSDLRFI